MRTLWRRLSALFQSGRLDREMRDEMEAHLAMQEEEFRRAGMGPMEARLAARREFGGVAQTQEAYRERRGVFWAESAARDLRYAVRGLRNSPGFAAAAVVSLALGIGANTAVFSMFHALMLRMLPVARPAELVSFYRTGGWGEGFSSYPLYLDVRKRSDLFQGVIARTGLFQVRFQATPGDRPEMAQREYVSGNYFALLGVRSTIGRLFTDDDDLVPQGHPVVVLSDAFWRNRFGADPGMLGRTIFVDEHPLTVIGVASAGFSGIEVERRADFWVPAMMAEGEILSPNRNWVWIVARRKPEISRTQIQAATDALMRQHLEAHFGSQGNTAFRRMALQQHLEARDSGAGLSVLRDQFGGPLKVLMGAVGLVLLVACMNVANLLLARGAARRKEIALRYSLGATRGRLVRQSFTESLVLALCGCGMGVLFAFWGESYIIRFLPAAVGEPFSTRPDATVLAFTVAASLISAILFGLAPALRSTAVDPGAGFTVRGTAGQRQGLRQGLVVAQIAFSTVLVVLAGLFAHSLAELRAVDPGFRNMNVVSFQLQFPRSWSAAEQRAARERFLAEAESLPGVLSVSSSFPGPFRGGSANATVRIPGSEQAPREPVTVEMQYAGPRHFETVGSMPIQGRDLDRNDTATSRKVALVNEAFVRTFLAGEKSPLQRAIYFDLSAHDAVPTYIVGVVRSMTHYGLRRAARPTVYVPLTQMEPYGGHAAAILVRAQSPVPAIVAELRTKAEKLGSQVALTSPRTLQQQIDDSIFQDRLLATLSGFFGVLALGLAAVGLYGVMAYTTTRRAGEIGIRIALGARRLGVLWMVLREALLLVSLGLALGLPAALAAGRAVAAVLFGVKPADPATLVMTGTVLGVVGAAAAFLPAKRAASLEPLEVLRHD